MVHLDEQQSCTVILIGGSLCLQERVKQIHREDILNFAELDLEEAKNKNNKFKTDSISVSSLPVFSEAMYTLNISRLFFNETLRNLW